MAKAFYRIKPQVLAADLKALIALHQLRDYAPLNPAYTLEQLEALHQKLEQTEQMEIESYNSYLSARDARAAAEWALHDAMVGAKAQVLAQYGADSDAIQAMGLKKRFKRRAPARRLNGKSDTNA